MNIQIDLLLNKSFESLKNSNFELAEIYLKQAVQLQPKNPHILGILGSVLAQCKKYPEALEYLNYSLKIFPKNPEVLSNLGNVFLKLREYQNAIVSYNQSIEIDSINHAVWSNKGYALYELRRYDEAIAHYDKALTLKPDYAEAWSNKGLTLHEFKQYDEAIAHYDKALNLKPDYVEAWSNKGNTLQELKRYDEAIAHYDKALDIKFDYECGWFAKGNVLHELKRFDEAIAHYDKALSLKPDYHEALTNKGVTLHELKCFDEAVAHYDKALCLKPNCIDASWNKSITLLLQGDFEIGLPLYESRWDSKKVSETAGKRIFDKPTWLGVDSLAGKTILIYGEQGLGDFIQFCRYVRLVADLGANVILEVPKPLASLMWGLQGVSQIVTKGELLPYFDYQCPLLSLPLAFGTSLTTIPFGSPYLIADSNKVAKWEQKLGKKRKIRVGVAWSSMSNFKDDTKRSLLLADFIKALPLDGFEYVCLQKELKEYDVEFLKACRNIQFFGDEFADFSDTAALIANVDLVISTCTSIPHLSGALGKETWILLSYVPDWRWLLGRKDSPWYPSIKLYRQTSIGDWNSVFDRVKLDLRSSFSNSYLCQT